MNTSRHVTEKKGFTKKANKLIHEKSPYLLQHAYNPVNWYPWGTEAFEVAKKEDKPIFLSIGYSTCHWCHVMEEESFEDEEVAKYLNGHFVAIKVDKEERPDIDSIYMSVCQKLTGSGGWPLTILMMPDQKPFFAGTYFPKQSKPYMTGLMDLLRTVVDKWKNERKDLEHSASVITDAIKAEGNINTSGELSGITKKIINRGGNALIAHFDREYGGFGKAPKFPTPHHLMFLLRYAISHSSDEGIHVVERTLDAMYLGGLYDHIGYGFSRYSTNKEWLVPHFEKMLYDNGLLIIAYLEAYHFRKNDVYKEIAIRTMDYVMRELRSEEGGFYCAQDADSEGVEGKYYVFRPEEIINLLGKEKGDRFNKYYHITRKGNFEGANIPNRLHMDGNTDHEFLDEEINELNKKVYEYRLKRYPLHKDDKILTSWNGIMIAAFSYAYKVLKDERYISVAKKAENFIYENLNKDGKLFVHYRENTATGHGHVDDYAYYIYALIQLYEATFELMYLKRALEFHEIFVREFFDYEEGGFYFYSNEGEALIHRPKEIYDSAIPSANSVALYNVIKLARYIGSKELIDIKDKQMSFMAKGVSEYPSGHSFAIMAGMLETHGTKELICLLNDNAEIVELKDLLSNLFIPNLLVIIKDKKNKDEIESVIPYLKDYPMDGKLPVFYLCENYSCKAPVNDFNKLKKMLIELT